MIIIFLNYFIEIKMKIFKFFLYFVNSFSLYIFHLFNTLQFEYYFIENSTTILVYLIINIVKFEKGSKYKPVQNMNIYNIILCF